MGATCDVSDQCVGKVVFLIVSHLVVAIAVLLVDVVEQGS
jgi:hypothetical protein